MKYVIPRRQLCFNSQCWTASVLYCWSPSVIAGQYATSHCKPLLVMFMKWRCINVKTFDL